MKLLIDYDVLYKLKLQPIENICYLEIPTLSEVKCNTIVDGLYAESIKLSTSDGVFEEYYICSEEKELSEAILDVSNKLLTIAEMMDVVECY